MPEQSLNIPQLLAVLLITFFAIRWYISPSTTTHSSNSSARQRRGPRPEQIEQIAQMFPQLDRRSIGWDLARNGGNVGATTERILGRGLDVPPLNFQLPAVSTASPSTSSTPSSRHNPAASQPKHPDLITRYNLGSKVNAPVEEKEDISAGKKPAWSGDKAKRQAELQKRKEEMILKARQKMLERVEKERKGEGS
ncbi:putative AMFR protein [Patellaria atrata CBS 101060]|uniref:Coupling of ubiquitin conjugation to ER degradation protein 1 n=1 Tax=Patellaria atrata CBS 101060 TaxID=1346257 RepID=A0A9P4S5R9_9PEZI|nr:putative AMFR protein [Patellaria atrata CBS 101060]